MQIQRLLDVRLILVFSITISVVDLADAQGTLDPESLPQDSFHWTQEQREVGFLHYDEVFPAREIPAGSSAGEMKEGPAIAAFEDGGSKVKSLQDFMNDQKVAGLIVMQNGKIRLERYSLGLTREGKWTSHSVAKSVTSTLVGAAIKDGYIRSVNDYVTDYIPDLKDSPYDSVTIHHILSMSTGVHWNESYADDGSSDLMNYWSKPVEPGINATVSYMRRQEADAKPGEKWVYSTGETHLLGVLVSTVTEKSLSKYLSEKIWIPYGMESDASWGLGRSDVELAGCCIQARLRDFARFGQFMLEGAVIDGESIVPDDWFESATSMLMPVWGAMGYGYQWWSFTDGTYEALGIHGQVIHIDPKREMVIAINSAWPEAENNARSTAMANIIYSIAYELDREKKSK